MPLIDAMNLHKWPYISMHVLYKRLYTLIVHAHSYINFDMNRYYLLDISEFLSEEVLHTVFI
jgi:hypothetical protein